ncbi:hypothetical protein LT85_1398 [Collimonas arenae]|uniref:Tle cognate immunity protein 4 C-terminal domain-containing protein n=1 Tax=Collimonas arenae TaxID=279058 RepID=A0A0A1F7P6_9BURK|nr:T6SS immunity protein Tli4 family protein [Collimonas arenae]AIY40556.1 hypothetical protein LT85_1398 [Collimonas arenae]
MMNFTMFAQVVGTSILGISLSVCVAKEMPTNWKSECVGRLQLDLPTEADIAAYSAKRLNEEINIETEQQFHFEDGQSADWSALWYGGKIYVSHPLNQEQYVVLTDSIKKYINIPPNFAKKEKRKDGSSRQFDILPTDPLAGYAWRVNSSYRAFLKTNNHVLWWKESGDGPTDEESERHTLATILHGLSYRAPYSVPHVMGVCLPFEFIQDDGDNQRYRSIGMTYRLKAHPDVTIMLKDASARKYDSEKLEKIAQPDYVIDDFWTQYRGPDTSIRSVWDFPIKRSVTLAGQKGLASFVKITRDGNIDYGYFATVRGDPKAKADTPDLRLYVIQEGSKAKAKGIEPIGKEEFLKIAETIAASVQRRPTQ